MKVLTGGWWPQGGVGWLAGGEAVAGGRGGGGTGSVGVRKRGVLEMLVGSVGDAAESAPLGCCVA